MKFPGSKLLHHWDLSLRAVSLQDLLRSCQQVGLTGLAEVKAGNIVGMIFYYYGSEVNALYREGAAIAFNGGPAVDRLCSQDLGDSASLTVYELPVDMAHMLRGISNRQKLPETLRGKASFGEMLVKMEAAHHTGTLEIQLPSGAAMVLLVGGRVSNVYWETAGGLTYEKGDARQRLEATLEKEEAMMFLSEFSRDAWKSRQDVQANVAVRLDADVKATATDLLAADEKSLRDKLVEGLFTELPSVLHALFFDLLTGSVLSRKVRGTSAIAVSLLGEKLPRLTMYFCEIAAVEQDEVEMIDLSTSRVSILVAIVPGAQEAVAVIAGKAQPGVLIRAALTRAVRGYATRLHPSRGVNLVVGPS